MIAPVLCVGLDQASQKSPYVKKNSTKSFPAFYGAMTWRDNARATIAVNDAIKLFKLENQFSVDSCYSYEQLKRMVDDIFSYLGKQVEQKINNKINIVIKEVKPDSYCPYPDIYVKNPEYRNSRNVLLRDEEYLKAKNGGYYNPYNYDTKPGFLIKALSDKIFYQMIGYSHNANTTFRMSEVPELFAKPNYQNRYCDEKFFNSDLFEFINRIAYKTDSLNKTLDKDRTDLIIPSYCTNGDRDTYERRDGYNLGRNKAIALLLSKIDGINWDDYSRATVLLKDIK